jgi:hypothetical protein
MSINQISKFSTSWNVNQSSRSWLWDLGDTAHWGSACLAFVEAPGLIPSSTHKNVNLGCDLFVCIWYWGLNAGPPLARQVLYHSSYTPSPEKDLLYFFFPVPEAELRALPPSLLLWLFWDRVSFYAQDGLDGPQSSYLCFLCSWNDKCIPPCPASLVEMGYFCTGWPWIEILLIFTASVF